MLHAMSRHSLRLGAWIPFAVVVVAPFVVACDLLKKDDADAAAVAPAVPVVPAVAPGTPADPAAVAPGVAPVAPLGAVTVTPAGAVKPVAVTDGGKPAEAGAAVVDAGDAGKTAPTPTPTFTIPTAIPGFDAGGFKPPAGFPSTIPTTLPTFPPPPK
jgi:hypothetical protein